jgi:hypothetical protein
LPSGGEQAFGLLGTIRGQHYTIAAGVKSATRNLADYKRRTALVIGIIAMGANGFEI